MPKQKAIEHVENSMLYHKLAMTIYLVIGLIMVYSITLTASDSGAAHQCILPQQQACGHGSIIRGQSHIGIPSACFLRVDPGPCSKDLVRIYYDSKTFTCKAFSYSGCGGNANRFISVKNCYRLCHPYYRQKLITLGADTLMGQKGTFVSNATIDANNGSAKDSNKAEVVNFSGENLNDNEGNASHAVPPNAPEFNTTEEPAEIQVIHEYDVYQNGPGQMMGNPYQRRGVYDGGYPNGVGGYPNPYSNQNPNPNLKPCLANQNHRSGKRKKRNVLFLIQF